MGDAMDEIGIVVIGRNEGKRLVRCLEGVRRDAPGAPVVYVDSGSTDGSVEAAGRLGVDVVALDMSIPFTAARARNAGAERLRAREPAVEAIQFVDGDCELAAGWLDAARHALAEEPRLAAVCGRLRERRPEATVYNAMADIEWDGPVGEVRACGGNAMYRAEAFHAMGGFDPRVPAGEEPELCLRLRRSGWTIRRIGEEMGLHDADMTRFSQLWRRSVRGGHGYAQGVWMHGRGPERLYVRRVVSILAWTLSLPAGVLAAAAVAAWPGVGGGVGVLEASAWAAAGLLGLHAAQAARLILRERRARRDWSLAAARGGWLHLGKFAELLGMVTFVVNRLHGRGHGVIEHRRPSGG
ncbi:MAG: glycosyltransferase family 2 protein [Planctomycetota bacterium]|jgi:GT2 family glycosyltransferase